MNPLQQQKAVFKYGVVSAIDPKAVKARVRFDDLDGLVSDWLPVGQRKTLKDRDYWMVDVGEHVACLMDENAEEGVIVCAIYSDADAPPVTSSNKRHVTFEDGATIEYDRSTSTLDVAGVRHIRVFASEQISFKAPVIHCLGELRVTGSIQASGDVVLGGDVAAGGRVIDVGGNTNHHSH